MQTPNTNLQTPAKSQTPNPKALAAAHIGLRLGASLVLGVWYLGFAHAVFSSARAADEPSSLPRAFIDGTAPGFHPLTETNFTHVNCDPTTFTWSNGFVHCTGQPIGVIRTTGLHTNFELVAQWRHLQSGGNSGIFVWATPESIAALEAGKGRLPTGIEVQVLDHGYKTQYEAKTGKKADFFTTDGDVFPTGTARMKPFPPTSPNGQRSFPRAHRSKGTNEWNHYYVRAINGEVRLWVNGEEVSGGTGIQPPWGYVCLESEGAPVEFRDIRMRELP